MFLQRDQKERIAQAISQAEAQTSGEFVAVIAHAADDYHYIPLLWAALCALAIPSTLLFLGIGGVWDLTLYQLVTFIVASLLFSLPWLKMHLIPLEVKQRRAALLAREQFLAQGLHHTKQRNGILLFVSIAEHHVEILADQGINAVVAEDAWDRVIQQFVQEVKAQRVEQGFINAVQQCGELLRQHFPLADQDVDELPNRLIELE